MNAPVLLGDVGGTHTRLALYGPGKDLHTAKVVGNAQYGNLESIVAAFIAEHCEKDTPRIAALALAGPVSDGSVTLTNLGWRIQAEELKRRFRFDAVYLMNDLCAAALAVPLLEAADRIQIGPGQCAPDGAIGVLGPGTGLGVAGLVKSRHEWTPIAGEGGHVTVSPRGGKEREIVERLEQDFGHVSAERILSGPGIENLYRVLAKSRGPAPAAPEISRRAISGTDPVAVEALDLFFAVLGTVAGDLALTLGATGGIYLCGGILPGLRGQLEASRFRERFTDKGRYRRYLDAIPTFLMTGDAPALHGLRHFVDTQR